MATPLTADLRAELKRSGTPEEAAFLDPFLVSYEQLVAQPEALEALAERLGAIIVSSNRDIAVDVLSYLRAVVGALSIRKAGQPRLGDVLMAGEKEWSEANPDVPYIERGMTTLLELLD